MKKKIMSNTSNEVFKQFRFVFNEFYKYSRHLEKGMGLSRAQLLALDIIADSPGISMGGFANALDIHQSTASNLIKDLQKKNLVEVIKAKNDRRNVCINLLADGRRLLHEAHSPLNCLFPDVLAKLDQNTLNNLDRDLERFIAALVNNSNGRLFVPDSQ